ncbi:MAG: HAD family hydrolase [Halapricum sp.]
MDSLASPGAVSFDLFGTLVAVDRPADPAAAVADALDARGIDVPEEWESIYAEPHQEIEPGREYSLVEHVSAVLRDRTDSDFSTAEVHAAVLHAFDSAVRTREGAVNATDAAAASGPIGICSNCAVPGLVERTLSRSALDPDRFEAVVTSVDCGWRKPHPKSFEAIADAIGTTSPEMVHIGDDPDTDGGASNPVLLSDRSLADLAGTWRRD